MTKLKILIPLVILCMGLAGCVTNKGVSISPRVEAPRLPPLPARLLTAQCRDLVKIPQKQLSSKELVALLAKVRASEAYKARCGKDFEAWYGKVRSSYGPK
jgi:PBP1b-binding outer membrane lipoprotein LpoB